MSIKLCGFDLETMQDNPAHGLQPWRAATGEATIKSVAVWISETQKRYIKEPSKETLRAFLVKCAADKIVLVGWNVLFDIQWLLAIGLDKEVKACTWMDAMLLLKRVDGWRSRDLGGRGYSLKDVVALRWPEYADYGLGEDVTKVPQTDEEWTRLLEYNLLDSKFTTLLTYEYLEKLTPEEQKAARQEAAGIIPIAQSGLNGICINRFALENLKIDVTAR